MPIASRVFCSKFVNSVTSFGHSRPRGFTHFSIQHLQCASPAATVDDKGVCFCPGGRGLTRARRLKMDMSSARLKTWTLNLPSDFPDPSLASGRPDRPSHYHTQLSISSPEVFLLLYFFYALLLLSIHRKPTMYKYPNRASKCHSKLFSFSSPPQAQNSSFHSPSLCHNSRITLSLTVVLFDIFFELLTVPGSSLFKLPQGCFLLSTQESL